MTCYQISEAGVPVALVASLAIARAIVDCQPAGFYAMEEIEVEAEVDVASGRELRAPGRLFRRRGWRRQCRTGLARGLGAPAWREEARRPTSPPLAPVQADRRLGFAAP